MTLLNLFVAPAAPHSLSSLDGLDPRCRQFTRPIGDPRVESLLGSTADPAHGTIAPGPQRR